MWQDTLNQKIRSVYWVIKRDIEKAREKIQKLKKFKLKA